MASGATFGPSPVTTDGKIIGAIAMIVGSAFTGIYISIFAVAYITRSVVKRRIGLGYETKQTIMSKIGFAFGFNVILGGNVSGASMNPARSFGPALIVWNFDYQWIYWVAPILGGLIASGLYMILHKDLDLPSPENAQIK